MKSYFSHLSLLIKIELNEWFRRPIFWFIAALFFALLSKDFLMTLSYTKDVYSLPFIFQDMALALTVLSPYIFIKQLQSYQNDSRYLELTSMQSGHMIWLSAQFIAAILLGAVLISLTIVFPLILTFLDSPDWGVIVSAYIGLLCLHISLLSITLVVMSFCRSIVAVYVILVLALILSGLFPILDLSVVSFIGSSFEIIHIHNMFNNFFYGAVDLGLLLKIIVCTVIILLLANSSIRKLGVFSNE